MSKTKVLEYALWCRNLTHGSILYEETWSVLAQLCMNICSCSQNQRQKTKVQQSKLSYDVAPSWQMLALHQPTSIFHSSRWGLFTGEPCAHTPHNRDATTHLVLTINNCSTAVFQSILSKRTQVKMRCAYLQSSPFSYLQFVSQKTKGWNQHLVARRISPLSSSPPLLRKDKSQRIQQRKEASRNLMKLHVSVSLLLWQGVLHNQWLELFRLLR